MIFGITYKSKLGSKLKLRMVPAIILGICLIGIVIGVMVMWHQYHHNQIPNSISKQLDFLVLYPNSPERKITAEVGSYKYDKSSKLLTFIVIDSGLNITISEQSTPQAFVDIPQSYTTLINSMNNYTSFDSLQGHVDLTMPKEFNGQQAAVMNTKGTLMFARPTNGKLTSDQWKSFFNSIIITK